MPRKNKRDSAQSILGARARKLEGMLAAHGLTLAHTQAMEMLAKLDGHRTRHTSPAALAPNNTKKEGATTATDLLALKETYERSQARVDQIFPDLGRAIAKALGVKPPVPPAAAALASLGEPVSAEAHDDHRVFDAEFDARPYLAEATADDIRELIECGWANDLPADSVAQHASECLGNAEVTAVLDYATRIKGNGFECSVDASEAIAWLRNHRPETLARALAGTQMDADEMADDYGTGMCQAVLELRSRRAPETNEGPTLAQAPTEGLAFGCTLVADDNGNYYISPPLDVSIGGAPGEGWMIGQTTHRQALARAMRHLATLEAAQIDAAATTPEAKTTPAAFKFGCRLEIDQDGDWVLVPPSDVTIFTEPGEGYLIGRTTRVQAVADAVEYLKDMELDSEHIARHVGVTVVPVGAGFAWIIEGGDDPASSSGTEVFTTEEEAWNDADSTVTGNTMGNHDLSSEDWDAMTKAEQIELAKEIY